MSGTKSSWTREERGDLGVKENGLKHYKWAQVQLKIDQAELKASAIRYTGLNTSRPDDD